MRWNYTQLLAVSCLSFLRPCAQFSVAQRLIIGKGRWAPPECPCSLEKWRKTCTASSFLVHRVESKIRWEMSSTKRTVVYYKDLRNSLAKLFSWMLELGPSPELLHRGEGAHAPPVVLLVISGVKGSGAVSVWGGVWFVAWWEGLCQSPCVLVGDRAKSFLCISRHVQSTLYFGYVPCRGLRAMINKWLQKVLRDRWMEGAIEMQTIIIF